MVSLTVETDDDGMRFDRWCKRRYPGLTQGLLEKALRKGDILLAGKKALSSARVQAGQDVTIRHLPAGAEEAPTHAPAPVAASDKDVAMLQDAVLFRDNEILIINKPAGLAVQGGSGVTKSVDGMLGALRFDARERPRLVHRLDRDTSGVLVLARTSIAARRLMPMFAGKAVDKTYWALVVGSPAQTEGKIAFKLLKQTSGDVEKVTVDEAEGKRAVTLYRVIERLSGKLAWVELTPVTGRTHQLRVHMSASGTPILGDGKYGGRAAFVHGMDFPHQLHLHARRIHIPGWFDVIAPLPPHMQKSWAMLGLEAEE